MTNSKIPVKLKQLRLKRKVVLKMKTFTKGLAAMFLCGALIGINFNTAEAAETPEVAGIEDLSINSLDTEEMGNRLFPPPRDGHRPPPPPPHRDRYGPPPPPRDRYGPPPPPHGHRPPPPPPRHGHRPPPPPHHGW